MVSLLDIAPVVDTIEVNGERINIPGVSVEGLASLMRRYAVFNELLSKGNVTPEKIMAAGPQLVAAVIAAGSGHPANEEVEQIAAHLNLQAQIDLLTAILRRTMPKGIGPFIESLNRLMAVVSDPVEVIQAKIEKMKASQKPSPNTSKHSSDGAGMPHEMSGP